MSYAVPLRHDGLKEKDIFLASRCTPYIAGLTEGTWELNVKALRQS